MTDLLSTGISGLLASQLGMNTTGNNISNVNTAGYSRQDVLFGTNASSRYGSAWIGGGVNVESVRRIYDLFLTNQVRDATGAQSRTSTFNDLSTRVDNLLADTSAGLQPSLDAFFGSLGDLANDPSDSATRQTVLGQANSLTSRLHNLSGQLGSLEHESDQRLGDEVSQINTLSKGVADLNAQILRAGNSPPNDLLDKRDELVRQLATHVGVKVTPQDGNQVNVTIGNGQPLVLGTRSLDLKLVPNAYDPTQHDIAASDGSVITSQVSGGALGGILDFRRDMLTPARNALGRTAIALADAINQQHRAGMDLNGQL
ncbi:MAG: flagellar hook-associated protein FlgK, partial [Dokdonella sp.]